MRRIPGSGACEWTDPWGITFTRLAIPITLTAAALAAIRHRDAGDPAWGGGPGTDPPPRATPSSAYPDEPPF